MVVVFLPIFMVDTKITLAPLRGRGIPLSGRMGNFARGILFYWVVGI